MVRKKIVYSRRRKVPMRERMPWRRCEKKAKMGKKQIAGRTEIETNNSNKYLKNNMKKIFTSIALLSMLAVGCTKTDDLAGTKPGNSFTTAEEASGYMAINIVTPGGANTRATYDPTDDTAGSGKYEDGTGAENKVENIRFYFFKDGNGGKVPAKVKKNPESTGDDNAYYSYIDYKVLPHDEEGQPDKDHSETVEKIVRLTVALNFPEGEEPKYVIAVVNPTAAVTDGFGENPAMPTLAELEAQVANFQPTITDGNYDSFIMSSSVYKKDGKVNFAEMGMLFNTMEEAEAALKDASQHDLLTVIYVERIAARLDLYVQEATTATSGTSKGLIKIGENLYDTQKKYRRYNQTEADEVGIYVKFKAWQVISTPKRSNLLKDISVDASVWPDAMFGATEPWNADIYHRSFWAINPSVLVDADLPYDATQDPAYDNEAGIDYQFYSYEEIVNNGIQTFGTLDNPTKVYMQENAAQGNTAALASTRKNHETKVIVAAELQKPDGTALEIAEYGYKYYEKEDLLDYFADMLPFYTKPYSENNNQQVDATDGNPGTHLTAANLEYKSNRQYTGKAGLSIEGGYYSFVKLQPAEQGSNVKWYKKGETESVSEATVQKYIDDEINSSSLLIWKGGRTYYYFTIRHLAATPTTGPSGDDDKYTYEDYQATPGYYGVVRNHIYRAGINELIGIGTPVYNEKEDIYPEKPNHDGHIMAAEIRVLSWRVVDQEYDFSW